MFKGYDDLQAKKRCKIIALEYFKLAYVCEHTHTNAPVRTSLHPHMLSTFFEHSSFMDHQESPHDEFNKEYKTLKICVVKQHLQECCT